MHGVAPRQAEVGDVITGKYLIEASLGEGGVGRVMMARNLELDERVALKFLKPEMLNNTEIVGRFMREAKAACSIKSEHVANVFDVGQGEDGAPYLVMEYLEGKDLGGLIHERGPLSVRDACEFLLQACEAIAVAHSVGIVHRDIKPENLFITTRSGMSVLKVLDFGISKTALTGNVFGSEIPLVKTVNLMGTPLYMSPEQVRCSDSIDARSDIWALGMVLYEMLTGTVPFSTTSLTELCAAILESPLENIAKHRNDLPPGFQEVLEKCVEKDPSRRYQNVSELAIALMPFAPSRARICAERATQVLSAKGMASPQRFDSAAPPTDPGLRRSQNPIYISSTIPKQTSVPNIPLDGTSSSLAAAAVTSTMPPPNRTRVVALGIAICALVSAAAAIIVVKSASSTPPATANALTAPQQATTTIPVSDNKADNTKAAPTETAAVAPKGTSTGATTAVVAAKGAPAPQYTWPPPKPAAKDAKDAKEAKPLPLPSTGPAKKSAEEPDLGY